MARTTPAVPSGLKVISSSPLSLKVYISLVTISELSPKVLLNTLENSKIGVDIGLKP